ncbi:Hypothetical predicted protein [Pelobates cultripes]|uniref:Uncharacterized protein n=1 Tax=Pelobates cultripes TaxID=61616 RepID=A0AAD1TMY3_PELCU|nr:Hypothetical predicted protein [Pelobates cultripes]
MDFTEAQNAILGLLGNVSADALPKIIHWMRASSDFEDFIISNNDVILRSISEDLRSSLPVHAMVSSESQAIQTIQNLKQPTLHVDAFLYDDETVDTLCNEGKMSRNYCLSCGSRHTAPIDFLSHSFSLLELKFLFQHVLPDLTGKTLIDVGSRLGAVLYAVKNCDFYIYLFPAPILPGQ